jgi:hypothetical protein
MWWYGSLTFQSYRFQTSENDPGASEFIFRAVRFPPVSAVFFGGGS